MKKHFIEMLIILSAVFVVSCSGGDTNGGTDTAGTPATADTMPVLHLGNNDSNGVIETPPTNDNNAIMPDSAIKNK